MCPTTTPQTATGGDPGLYYLQARYGACPEHSRRDPEIGRFLTRDPFPGLAGLPASQNAYAYVMNNPVNYVDPYGLFGLKDIKKAATKVGGAIAGGANTVYQAGDDALKGATWVACSHPQTVFGCAFVGLGPLGDSYFDVNLGICGATVGVQYKASQGFHPYTGPQATQCWQPTLSYGIGYNQDITTGWNCYGYGGVIAPVPLVGGAGGYASAGFAPLEDKEGGFSLSGGSAAPFWELGVVIGAPGPAVGAACVKVGSAGFLSW